jgi:murein DD-endopeptidase MepM/ murein hydrolase activator NlpD
MLAGRLIPAHPISVSPTATPCPTSTQPAPAVTATATPAPLPSLTPTPTAPPPTPTIQSTGTVFLDESNTTIYNVAEGCLVHPLRLLIWESDIYALDEGHLRLVALDGKPTCKSILPPDGMPVQVLGDMVLSGDGESLLLLDRAGNVFHYSKDGSWQLERPANAPQASSRQHLVTVSSYEDSFYLLDSNVGQIWKHNGQGAEVLPTDMDLRESVDLAVGNAFYVLAEEGYRGPLRLHKLTGEPLRPDPDFVSPSDLERPSSLSLEQDSGGYLYVVDQGHQRLRLLDAASGDLVREYLFAEEGPEFHAMFAQGQKFYLASRGAIYTYPREPEGPGVWPPPGAAEIDLVSLPPHDSRVLDLLPPFALPIEGTKLSGLSFRLPGAPRAYRYGVHEGIDFYWAAGEAVTSTTPVSSVAQGFVLRIDRDYAAPPWQELEALLDRAAEVHHTPPDTLDVLRGRQVWIDHGDGVVSRYCHLSAVADDLEFGDEVEQGQMIGYVGNSGTPASYYDSGLEMHLHLEIRIGEGYLGQHLRPVEVKRWLNRVFSEGA